MPVLLPQCVNDRVSSVLGEGFSVQDALLNLSDGSSGMK